MSRSTLLFVAGGGLVMLAVIGFLIVADDTRHVDELLQVGTALVAGIALVVAGCSPWFSKRFAVPWFVLGLAAGTILGTAVSRVPMGVGAGAVLGVFLGYVRRHPLGAPR